MGFPIRGFFVLAIAVMCVTATLGCDDPIDPPELEPTDVPVLYCGSADPNVDVYYDATPSMMGYLNDPRFAQLAAFDLENAIPVGSAVRLYKATTAIEGGIEETERMAPSRSDFYRSGDTDLATVIDSAKAEHLSIIVTDLFQTDADINRVARRLTEKYIQNGMAVGLIAVRYNFEGTIYDIGLGQMSRRYEGARPIYLLVLGDHCKIADFFDQIRSTTDYEFKADIFSPFLVRSPLGFGRVSQTNNIVQDRFGLGEAEHLVQMTISDNNDPASFEVPLSLSWAPYVVRPPDSEWTFELECKHQRDSTCTDQESGAVRLGAVKQDGITVLNAGIDPVDLRRGIYGYAVTVSPGTLTVPSWSNEWSVDLTAIQSGEFQGARTQNLEPFLRRLQSNIKGYNSPQLGQLHIYVNKER